MESIRGFSKEAKDYKREVAGRFILVASDKINEKMSGSDFILTRKYDGIMCYVEMNDGSLSAFNSSGQPLSKVPCLVELERLLTRHGVKCAKLAGELFATLNPDGRERVGDILSAIADPEKHPMLRFAAFDLMEFENEPVKSDNYRQILDRLSAIMNGGKTARVVRGHDAESLHEVETLVRKLIERGAEGAVVHCSQPFVYKIKPRHTFDAAVIGYTVGEGPASDMVRDIMVGVIHPDGSIQQIGTMGNGLSDMQRKKLCATLRNDNVDCDWFLTDSRGVAYQMVRPRLVVEFNTIDCVTENASGEPKTNMLLEYNGKDAYKAVMNVPGVALHSPCIVRLREDKNATCADVPFKQLSDLYSIGMQKKSAETTMPRSTLLCRKVYLKKSGLKRMVQKFVVWQTNKETAGDYPAYVLHHTDYNYSRQEQLKRDLRVSSSKEQIMTLLEEMILVNIKKGWEEII